MSTPLLPGLRSLAAALLISLSLVRPAAAVDWTDIWWNAAESGWGVNFVQADNFVFATFFLYGTDLQPTWVTANMTVDANGVWSGPLYRTNGPFYGGPWNPAQVTLNQVGTATFSPANSYSGTLTYNVGTTNVTKQITRQTLKTIPLGGTYSGALLSIFSNCTNAGQNGPITSFANVNVTLTPGGPLLFEFDSDFGVCTINGNYVQDGNLYRIPNAAYACYGQNLTAQISEIKSTSQGIEGKWTAQLGGQYAGCTESAFFSALFIF